MYKKVLDPADSIFAANYLLGYFGTAESAAMLMRMQKIADLKKKDLWEGYQPPYTLGTTINPNNPTFGINIYAVGAAVETRKEQPYYLNFLDATSSHINAGGWACCDFVITKDNFHSEVKLKEGKPPLTEYVLGWIRLDAGCLNNSPLTNFLGIKKLSGEYANKHILNAKVIVPTQPFGKDLRGGKLLALIATSNELKKYYENRFENREIRLFYTTSLYGSSKSSSQYDQLDRFIKYVGDTDGKYPLRMKEPHKGKLIKWLDDRGISRYQFIFKGSSKADRSDRELKKYIRYCLWKNQKDKTAKILLEKLDGELIAWKQGKTEKKRTYISTYGKGTNDNEYDMNSLFEYWKMKVFKKKDWGMRKSNIFNDDRIRFQYELITDQLKDKTFNQIR